jgi:hypothetical protein
MVLRFLGRLDRSLESLERAVELTPKTCGLPVLAGQARAELALTLVALGKRERARMVALEAHEFLANMPDQRKTLAALGPLLK